MKIDIIILMLLLTAIIIGRFINEKGIALLDDNKRSILMEGLSHFRIYQLAPLIVFIILFIALTNIFPAYYSNISIIFFILIVLHMIVMNVITMKKYRDAGIPARNYRLFMISRMVLYIGIAALFYRYITRTLSF